MSPSGRGCGPEDCDDVTGGAGHDAILGGTGTDVIRGGSGNDEIRSGPGMAGLLHGESGDDVMVAEDVGIGVLGEDGNDQLSTTHANVALVGGGDNDVITGGDHADTVDGGPGNDRIDVGGSNDTDVRGGLGDGALMGGSGNDHLRGGDGADVCDGGAGSDTCDGGALGGPENTPEDNDKCTAETLISCQGGAYPDRWQAKITGSRTYDNGATHETAAWTMDIVLRRGGDQDDTFWVFEPGDWSADLTLAPAQSKYFFDFSGRTRGTEHVQCETGSHDREPILRTWEDTGDADLVPFDPTVLRMEGSETRTTQYESATHTWTITPVTA